MNKLSLYLRGTALVMAATLIAACEDNSFQVIEELDFAAALQVDLSAMTMLSSGVYTQDVTVGDGDPVLNNSEIIVTYEGYLADGSQFGTGQFTFVMGQRQVIVGFEQGIVGMVERGQRRIIIPPDLGYADQDQNAIPAGSVLIFDVAVDSVVVDATGGTPN
ncbi:MAG: FKBP-type peptidyl-prolyl cis-trans isomerase [Gemmatimonadota bacterium]